MWPATVVVLLACIAIAVWDQRDALRNPETSKKQKKARGSRALSGRVIC
jgi:hypothetical protein